MADVRFRNAEAGRRGERRHPRPEQGSDRRDVVERLLALPRVGLGDRLAVAGGRIDAGEKLADPKLLGPDPVDRGDRAVEDVIDPAELAGPLEREDVERFLDAGFPEAEVRRMVQANPAAALGLA